MFFAVIKRVILMSLLFRVENFIFSKFYQVGSFNVSRIFEEAGSNGLVYRVYFKNFNTDTDPDVDPETLILEADRAIVSSVSQDSEFGPDASGRPEDPSSFGGAFILIDPSMMSLF